MKKEAGGKRKPIESNRLGTKAQESRTGGIASAVAQLNAMFPKQFQVFDNPELLWLFYKAIFRAIKTVDETPIPRSRFNFEQQKDGTVRAQEGASDPLDDQSM